MTEKPILLKRFIDTGWIEMLEQDASIALSISASPRALAREEKRREENTLSAKNADDVRFSNSQTNTEEPVVNSPTLPGMVPQEKQEPPRRGFEYTPEFERLWLVYPNHNGKGAGFVAFQKGEKNGMPVVDKLIPIIEKAKHSKQWKKQNGEFIPLLSTWLNQHRWDDDYDPNSGPRGVVC